MVELRGIAVLGFGLREPQKSHRSAGDDPRTYPEEL
jgi:hypothetical protein